MIKKPARLIRIENAKECSIIERLNRFVVTIAIDGIDYPAHITNTGRLSEFMIEGQKAFCFRTHHQGKTNFRLFAIEESGLGALIDTWLQMKAFEQALERNVIPWLAGCRMLKRNVLLGASHIDYLLECDGKAVYLEVKSAVLREGAYAMYPDCPSERGRKHIHELADHVQNGGEGILLFMAALPHVTTFKPNRAADAKLYEALKEAHAVGVAVRAMGLYYNPPNAGVYLANPDLGINLAQWCGVLKLFRQEVSPNCRVKLTEKKIKWAVKQVINTGESTAVVAARYGVSRRRIQQLVKNYKETGEYPVLDTIRRPRTPLSAEEKRIIEDAYNESFLGARLLRYHLKKHYNRNIP